MTTAAEKWTAGSGAGLTLTDCFAAADLNSLAAGSSVLSSLGDILNDTAKDMFAWVYFDLGSLTTVSPAFLALYLYQKNEDGTYGDNVFTAGTQSSATPSPSLQVATWQPPIGTQALKGWFPRIILSPVRFRFLLQNKNTTNALASSSNAVKYITANRGIG